jgi:hypothetical protein
MFPRDRSASGVDRLDSRRRNQIEVVLGDSLRHQVEELLAAQRNRAARKAISDLGKYRESDPVSQARINAARYTADQVLGDWFPPEPDEPPRSGE